MTTHHHHGNPVPYPARRLFRPAALLALLLLVGTTGFPAPAQLPELARQVEIRRTAYGVPHIRAENLRAAGYALGYAQTEDYGERVVLGLLRARGEVARHTGRESLDADFLARPQWLRAVESYHLLDQDTRDVYEGFAAGVNRYVELHPREFPEWLRPTFTGHDVLARDIGSANLSRARRALDRLQGRTAAPDDPEVGAEGSDADEGSNAWAFAPSRTRSGRAILMRNPHLSWGAGYYEAHVVVPGVLNFYGDFRIGGPFGVIGGFNEHLGWSTTNNEVDPDEVYALDADPTRPDHYRFDGASLPLLREELSLTYRNGEALGTETREIWHTPLGPVVHRGDGKIYVLRSAGAGEYRGGQQWLRMMRAQSLEEWKEAMRMLARTTSNFTYADRHGNIFYVWNGTVPILPHPPGGDTLAIPASRSSEVWTRLIPFDSLPQLRDPRGGYVRNENDPFHYTNLNQLLEAPSYQASFPAPRLGLRSQHSLELIHNTQRLSLEDVVRLKHSPRMLLADRVKDDLVAAVRASQPEGEVAAALELLARWDNTVAVESRGGVLFETWWREYSRSARGTSSGDWAAALYRHPWNPAEPMRTPRGLADPQRAAAAFVQAVAETKQRFGSWDVAWGEVHRVRRGGVDLPVSGCSGALGCFRVLSFREAEDGKRVVTGGDGWVIAVEFTDTPRAYSVLGYGQSAREDSPHFSDQAEMFARGEMKRVPLTEREIEQQTVRRYRPGAERERDAR